MKKLNIPQGTYTVTYEDEYDYAHVSHEGNMCLVAEPEFSDFHINGESNNLVAIAHDAIVTYNKCGKLPSELLEERNELVEALKYFTDKVDRGEARSKDTYAVFKALLTKIENNQTPQP